MRHKMMMKLTHAGMTIFEVLLVLVIGSLIFAASVNQYLSFRRDADIQLLQYNVDQYFIAAAQYYYGQCARTWTTASGPANSSTAGTLDPSNTPAPSATFILTPTMLATYTSFPTNMPISPLVDTTDGGFIVQFNQLPAANRTVAGKSVGAITGWQIQVSALLNDPTLVTEYLALSGATCSIAAPSSANSVSACPTGDGGEQQHEITINHYLVWERSPSMAVQGVSTDLWLTNPRVTQFKQMYTTLPINNVLENPNNQTYLCGD